MEEESNPKKDSSVVIAGLDEAGRESVTLHFSCVAFL